MMLRKAGVRSLLRAVSRTALVGTLSLTACAPAPTSDRRTFASAQDAADAVLDACRRDDVDALIGIFGPDGVDVVKSADPAADALDRKAFVAAATEKLAINEVPPSGAEIVIGPSAWPFPIRLVKNGARWQFDTKAGVEEILDRRIGGNERDIIALLRATIDAEYLYKNQDWDGDGVHEFAQHYFAQPGQFDGLYWPVESGSNEPLSPLNGFVESEGEYAEAHQPGDPWHGYRIKLLNRQGASAPGGAQDYRDAKGNLTRGFAAVAFPADYGSSGIMSFLVSHHGAVLERDLGQETGTLVDRMDAFEPEGWTPVERVE